MKPDGHRGVQAWLDEQIAETLYLTSISLSELLLGVEFLPDGKRKVAGFELATLCSQIWDRQIPNRAA
jgi:predicted nucleic acid-binding protein